MISTFVLLCTFGDSAVLKPLFVFVACQSCLKKINTFSPSAVAYIDLHLTHLAPGEITCRRRSLVFLHMLSIAIFNALLFSFLSAWGEKYAEERYLNCTKESRRCFKLLTKPTKSLIAPYKLTMDFIPIIPL